MIFKILFKIILWLLRTESQHKSFPLRTCESSLFSLIFFLEIWVRLVSFMKFRYIPTYMGHVGKYIYMYTAKIVYVIIIYITYMVYCVLYYNMSHYILNPLLYFVYLIKNCLFDLPLFIEKSINIHWEKKDTNQLFQFSSQLVKKVHVVKNYRL